jgi:hypothetical protein
MAMAAAFGPDGHGGIRFGTEDINISGSSPDINEAIIPQLSSYSLGSFGLNGCLQLGTAKGIKVFSFTFGPKTSIMENDDTTGAGERAIGEMYPSLLPDGTPGNFGGGIFRLGGWDIAGGHAAVAGNLATDGGGHITGGLSDTNDAGTVNARVSIPAGTYNIVTGTANSDGSGQVNGRGTFSFMAGAIPVQGVVYLGAGRDFLILSTTQVSASVPLLSGRGGGFTAGYLSNSSRSYLITDSGKDGATLGLVNLTSTGSTAGSITGTLWRDIGSTVGSTALSGTYTITDPTWGRVTFSGQGLNNAPVAYIGENDVVSLDKGAAVSTDSDAAAGTIILQSASPVNFSNSDLACAAAWGDETGDSGGITTIEGAARFTNSQIFGSVNLSTPTGLSAGQLFTAYFTVNPDGSGTMGPFPAGLGGTLQPMVVVSANASAHTCLVYFINEGPTNLHPVVGFAAK